MMNLIFCGLPCSGKTVVGKNLAEKLEWKFVDTDALIENAYCGISGKQHQPCQIFSLEGEHFFRTLETQQVTSLGGCKETVISTGGGVFASSDNSVLLKKMGVVIYLKTFPEVIWERLQIRGLPAFLDKDNPKESFFEIARSRLPHYERAADIIVDCNNKSEHDIVSEVWGLVL